MDDANCAIFVVLITAAVVLVIKKSGICVW